MTTGYLWTGQFEECASAVTAEGKGQSMELDSASLDGHWSTDNKTGMDFFIINDAIFSKLCILGDDVEPCFEGAKVTAPDVSTSFTRVDDGFKKTLYTMMQELKFALEGGQNMDKDNLEVVVDEVIENNEVEETVVDPVAPEAEISEDIEEVKEDTSEEIEEPVNNEENQNPEESFSKKDDEEKEDKEEDTNDDKDEDEDEEEKKKKEYSVLETEYAELQEKYSALEAQYQELVNFKTQIDNEKKDALIDSFYMLSDEDKKDVIENKANYSLDDIEAKLSIICFRKKVNFDLEDTSKNDTKVEEKETVTTYSLNTEEVESVPAFVSALRKTKNEKNN